MPFELKATTVAAEPGEGRAALKFGFGSSKSAGPKAKPAAFGKVVPALIEHWIIRGLEEFLDVWISSRHIVLKQSAYGIHFS